MELVDSGSGGGAPPPAAVDLPCVLPARPPGLAAYAPAELATLTYRYAPTFAPAVLTAAQTSGTLTRPCVM